MRKKISAALLFVLALGVGILIHPDGAKSQGTGGQGGSAITSSATAVDSVEEHFRFQELILGMSVQDARQAILRMGMRVTAEGSKGIEFPGISFLEASTLGQSCSIYNQAGICHQVRIEYGALPPQRIFSIRVNHTSRDYISLVAIDRALVNRYGSPSQNMSLGEGPRRASGEPNLTRLSARWIRRDTSFVSFSALVPGFPRNVDSIGGLQSFTIEIFSTVVLREAEAAFVEFVRRQPVPDTLRF